MGKLVEHVEHPIPASIVGAVLNKVVRPDVIAVLRPQPDARSVRQPEPAALGLLMGSPEPLASPDTLDPLALAAGPGESRATRDRTEARLRMGPPTL